MLILSLIYVLSHIDKNSKYIDLTGSGPKHLISKDWKNKENSPVLVLIAFLEKTCLKS